MSKWVCAVEEKSFQDKMSNSWTSHKEHLSMNWDFQANQPVSTMGSCHLGGEGGGWLAPDWLIFKSQPLSEISDQSTQGFQI